MTRENDENPLEKLLAPFGLADLSFRPGSQMGNVGFRLFAYIDARALMDRLDGACGPLNWSVQYEPIGEGFICKLSIRVDGEWVEKQGVGGPRDMPSEQDKIKSAATDAFRRAAAAWGMGAHLKRLPGFVWPAEKNEKGKFRKWTGEKQMLAQYEVYLRKQAEGVHFNHQQIIWPPRNSGESNSDPESSSEGMPAASASKQAAKTAEPKQTATPPEPKQAATATAPKYLWPAEGEPMLRQALVLIGMKKVRYDPQERAYFVGDQRVWNDGVLQCDCPELARARKTEPFAVCTHITAVKVYADEQNAKNDPKQTDQAA